MTKVAILALSWEGGNK